MKTKKTALQRLQELLDQKDFEIENLSNKVDKFESEQENLDWKWCRPTSLEKDVHGLPNPRLQLECLKVGGNWMNKKWTYHMVHKHLIGNFVFTPLGGCMSNGSRGDKPLFDDGTVILPFRDGAHIQNEMEQLNLRGFVICDDVVFEIVKQSDGNYRQVKWVK